MTRTSIGGIVGIAGAVTLSFVAIQAASAQTKLQGVSKTEIVIGTQTDLSGVAAAFGVNSANGGRLRSTSVGVRTSGIRTNIAYFSQAWRTWVAPCPPKRTKLRSRTSCPL